MKKSKRTNWQPLFLIILTAVLIVGGTILIIFLNSQPNGGTDDTTQAETTADPFDVEYDGFTSTGIQTMYAYCDADGDGECDNGANIFIRPKPTTEEKWTAEIFRGTEVKRIAVYYSDEATGAGWSKIVYNGQIYYVQNRYLSETDPGPGEQVSIGD